MQCSSGGHKITLDRDDIDWGGPETMTITETGGASSVYHHYVYIYSDPGTYVGSLAQVSLYTDRGLNQTISVEDGPTTAPGVQSNWRFWHTFRCVCISNKYARVLLCDIYIHVLCIVERRSVNTGTGVVNVVNKVSCDTTLSTGSTQAYGEWGSRNC
jgi:hypothetical protein